MSKDVNNIGNRSSLQKAMKDVDKEYMKNLWRFSMQVAAINTGRIQSEEDMQDRIQQLFTLCSETGNMPTYESIAVACGIPSRTFYDMRAGEYEGYKKYSQIIKKAKEQVAMIEAAMARDGKIPAPLWIFRAKNYLKMKDVQQIEAAVTPTGDVPTNSDDLISALPEAPEEKPIEVEAEESASDEK